MLQRRTPGAGPYLRCHERWSAHHWCCDLAGQNCKNMASDLDSDTSYETSFLWLSGPTYYPVYVATPSRHNVTHRRIVTHDMLPSCCFRSLRHRKAPRWRAGLRALIRSEQVGRELPPCDHVSLGHLPSVLLPAAGCAQPQSSPAFSLLLSFRKAKTPVPFSVAS